MADYVQELRTLIANMATDPLPEEVQETIFMKGLRNGAARNEVFRVYPSTFEEAAAVALNAEYSFESARLGWQPRDNSSLSRPKPMDLSYAEEEVELQAVE